MTSFDKVYDLFLNYVSDYKLDKLANLDYDAFKSYLKGILVSSIPLYSSKNILYDEENEEFLEILSIYDIRILASCMEYTWFSHGLNEVSALAGRLKGRDINGESSSTILKNKSAHLNSLKESLDNMMMTEQIRVMKEGM